MDQPLFPITRPRRMRSSQPLRSLVRETRLAADRLILPLFITHGAGERSYPVASMPGVEQLTVDAARRYLELSAPHGIGGVLLFGIPEHKDALGTGAYARDGVVQSATRKLKADNPNLLVVTDVCLCEYTDHGHCGLVVDGEIVNDQSLKLLSRTAASHAEAGADIVAPSDMMDGRVGAIRSALDEAGHTGVPILSYAAKYASAYYGPFRDAAGSTPQFGDRATYQMDPANRREALREVMQDIGEGADMIMVKPALAYLDILRDIREATTLPVAAYNVSGEYSMVKAAARSGWIDERRVVLENLTAMCRAGADFIFTYHALDAARWLAQGRV